MGVRLSRAIGALLLVLAAAVPASAQQVRLDIRDGRVTLHAQNASLRAILTEWQRVGGTRIVNLERVAGAPITIDLNNVPERQALDTLLRSVAGYLLAARQPASTGASVFDRIMILATSAAPPPTAASAARPVTFANGPATRVPQPQFDPNDPEENPPGVIGRAHV